MLGSPGPATASLYTAPASASPASTTRSGRLRGLSYLRSYTHNHLHSSARSERRESLPRSTSSPNFDLSPEASPVGDDNEPEQSISAVPSAIIHSGENGWIPTIQGRSGLDRESLQPTSTLPSISDNNNNSHNNNTISNNNSISGAAGMTRSRAATALGPTPAASLAAARRQSAAEGSSGMDPFSTPAPPPPPANTNASREPLPTIRFIPHVEARSSRPSLQFPAVSRTLKAPNGIVRVGRYSERDNNSGDQTLLPVGFKSKVVSRRHCELWCTDGQWYIKDVKSSSGTFLNHVRLSSPGVESRPYPVNDGDVVQLGIDFKGGEEIIFRCVKIRIECNRGWQKSLNTFNTSAHKRLFKHAVKSKTRDSDAASVNSSECSICLNPVAPCQALFVAPCSHVWHYKCIRNLIHGPTWPNFHCPNCRAVADLEADVEQPEEEVWEDDLPDGTSESKSDHPHSSDESNSDNLGPDHPYPLSNSAATDDDDLAGLMSHASLDPTPLASPDGHIPVVHPTLVAVAAPRSTPIPIGSPAEASPSPTPTNRARSLTPTTTVPFSLTAGVIPDVLMTPRNDAGPFVFDGSAGRERPTGDILAQSTPDVTDPGLSEDSID